MSGIEEDIRSAVAPLMREIVALRRQVEELAKPSAPQYITMAEAAKRLRVSQRTVARYCESGRLEVRRVGGKVLILSESLSA